METRWKLTRRSLTGAVLWLTLAVVCIIVSLTSWLTTVICLKFWVPLGKLSPNMLLLCSLSLSASTVCECVFPDGGAHPRLMEAGHIESEGWGMYRGFNNLGCIGASVGPEERAR